MKKTFVSLLLIVLMISTVLTSCDIDKILGAIDEETELPLEAPTNLRVDEGSATLYWNSVEYAIGYTVKIDAATYTTETNSFSLQGLPSGEYTISVKANGDGIRWISSEYSDTIQYTRNADSGNKYEDDVIAAFREFDEVNTKNSFLGYGIDIINANAITSKNVLMTYPIFDMNKLMDENLLKSNEHYNSFETIEANTIESFCRNMGMSSSITSGMNVSAKGTFLGGEASTSASLSSGLATSFTKTSELVESQYFLEIIAENQSYWLILQTSEQRYKDLLSEEFKSDLYNTAITPAQLFEKYGTHMLTSVAMGGNICMYYTMYSYDSADLSSHYAEISSVLKTNVEVAYGGDSAGVGTDNSFNSAFTYQALATSYGIHIDKKIVSAGGGSFGINNETTLYENYYDWQKSLDTYPVVIGIKDANSLYPIWNLLDLNVPGASERYDELYKYFQTYGATSYNSLCEMYSITPTVAPTEITNIKVGSHINYSENQTVNVKAGESFKISFDVEPHNANKYQKTFAVDNTALATIDSTGLINIAQSAPGGSYIKVTIAAGPISKQIKLYVINTYNVAFNTRMDELNVDPIHVTEGHSIKEPQLTREGYYIEGWYTDSANTNKFDFENDSVTSDLTLYANWVPIKPIVTFDVGDGSKVDSQTLAYKATVKKPKNPTLSGYTFDGWYINEEYTEQFDFTTKVVNDITLYAKWTRVEFTVTFVTNGGTPVASTTTSITDGYKISEPITTKQYYTLDGWYKDDGLTQKYYFESEITSDITLYAKWTPVKSVITFVDADGISKIYDEFGAVIVGQTTDIEKDFKITAPIPWKEGYTFVGWYLNGLPIDLSSYSDFKPCDDGYTIVARWKINQYTITFNTDGGSIIAPITEDYGTRFVVPLDPTKTGHTFAGWDKIIPETMPASDITITAKWTVNKYTITFNTDGGSIIAPITEDYGTRFVAPLDPTKTGHTFAGWDKIIPETMPASDITITARWTINSYTFTYKVDGVEYYTKSYAYGEKISLPADPIKEGYTFVDWDITVPTIMPAENVVTTAKWLVNTHYVTFNIDDEEYSKVEYKFGEEIIYPDIRVEGYTFSGWKYGYKELPKTMPDKDVTISGTLTINTYTVTYYVDGEKYETHTYTYGSPLNLIKEPYIEGGTFSGWYCSTLEDIPKTMPASDLIINGRFNQTPYSIKYYIDYVLVETVSLFIGDRISAFVPEDKAGYTFSGWHVKEGEVASSLPEIMPAKDLNVYGNYHVNEYTITYIADGSVYYSQTANYGAPITKPENPIKIGHTFSAWDKIIPETMPNHDIIVNAKWTINSYTFTCMVDGVEYYTKSYTYGEEILLPADPTKEGHTFANWDKAIPKTMPNNDTIVNARWTINSYTFTCIVDGVEYYTKSYSYGEEILLPADPTKEGYTFESWNKIVPETMPATDIIITAKWTVNEYTITFNTDGGSVVSSITQKYGTDIIIPENPTKKGYTFANWDQAIPATMPAKDLIITAIWTINSYTFTCMVDGVEYYTKSYTYGEEISLPADPAKEGYTFESWNKIVPETMPNHDIIVTAIWTINSYTFTCMVDGVEYYTKSYAYGEEILLPADPTKEGHTFADWDKVIPEIMPNHDIIVNARWTINSYTFTCMVDGVEYYTKSYTYGEDISLPADPIKTGFEFTSWDESIPETMPNHDIIVNAIFKKYSSKIYYEDNFDGLGEVQIYYSGGTDTEYCEDISYGVTQINTAAAKTYSDYYNFLGWYTEKNGGVQLTNSKGELLANVIGYTDSNKNWIKQTFDSITLYGRWEQKYSGKYIYNDFDSLNEIRENLSGTYVIIEDIDLIGKKWEPLDTFFGTIDGTGHTISNLSITISTDMAEDRVYGFVTSLKGTIKNLTIKDAIYQVTITNPTKVKATRFAMLGTFTGELLDEGKIENCKAINPILTCYARSDHGPDCQWKFVFVGGIVGYSVGTIKNCTVSSGEVSGRGSVKFDGQFLEVATGGIAGILKAGIVANCTVENVLVKSRADSWGEGENRAYDAFANAGGLAGLMNKDTVTVQPQIDIIGGVRDAIIDIAYQESRGEEREDKYNGYVGSTVINSRIK